MSLVAIFPEVASEFHPTRNEGLDVGTLTYGSSKRVWWLCRKGCETPGCSTVHEWVALVATRTTGSGCPFCHRLCQCQTLIAKFPEIAVEFHPTRNEGIDVGTLTYGSHKKVWWLCRKQCATPGCSTEHEWIACVKDRTRGSGCPFCTHNRLCQCQSLIAKYPQVAAEFHPTRNEGIDVGTLTYGSNKRVWWLCIKGCQTPGCPTPLHEWQTRVADRTHSGNGCPFCAHNKATCRCQTLSWRCPELVRQWHPTNNGSLLPTNVAFSSHLMVWWICRDGHEWQAAPNSRTNMKSGCPVCNVNKAETALQNWVRERSSTMIITKESYYMPGNKHRLTPDGILTFHTTGRRAMIELDGPQHFESVGFWGGRMSDHEGQARRDCIKNKWAFANGYSILRVSHLEYKDLDQWLERFVVEAEHRQTLMVSNPALYNRLAGR